MKDAILFNVVPMDKDSAYPVNGSHAALSVKPAQSDEPNKEVLERIDKLVQAKLAEGFSLEVAYDIIIADHWRKMSDARDKKKEYDAKIKETLVYKEKERFKREEKEHELFLSIVGAERNGAMKQAEQSGSKFTGKAKRVDIKKEDIKKVGAEL
jgi:hypothetical protein